MTVAETRLYQQLGDTLHRLARHLDGLLLEASDEAVGDLRTLRLLTTDALHTLGVVVEADEARRFGGRRLDVSLRRMAAEFEACSGSSVDVRLRGDLVHLPPSVAEVVRHVVHEAFAGVSRNARSTITVLAVQADDRAVRLDVLDDGVDLPQRQVAEWRCAVDLGLRRMARAAASVDGHLAVQPVLPRGLLLRAVLPLPLATGTKR